MNAGRATAHLDQIPFGVIVAGAIAALALGVLIGMALYAYLEDPE